MMHMPAITTSSEAYHHNSTLTDILKMNLRRSEHVKLRNIALHLIFVNTELNQSKLFCTTY